MTDLDRAHFHRLLTARKTELEEARTKNADASGTVELDQARVGRLSRMDALQGQAMAQAADRRRALELSQIEAAFGRLESEDFGYCLRCDEDIQLARLEIAPTTTLCIDCAKKAEVDA